MLEGFKAKFILGPTLVLKTVHYASHMRATLKQEYRVCSICLSTLYIICFIYFQIDGDRNDRRLHFPRQNSAITKYMDAAWRIKEQTENLN
jgi:hypothetical protein